MLRNKHLKLQAQQMAMNVLNYFGCERDNGGAFIPFTSRTAEACGTSINTLTTIKNRFNEAEIENQPVQCSKSKMLRNKHLKLQAQQMAMNVLNYFGCERDNGGAFIPFTSRTAEACGTSINTLTTIKNRFNEAEIENQPVQCSSKCPRCKPKSVNVDNYIKDFVKRKIYEMHTNHMFRYIIY
ncbi:hypothetical protein FQA39_LY15031 [Lamprigera yunnana]|nr:hypothetical protein FQA39_LY15031 [Lamprigera yunnana]